MEMEGLLSPLIFVIVSLIVGGVLKFALKKTPFPYTVGLFLFGLIVGLLVRFNFSSIDWLNSAFDDIGNMNPDMILYVFLPILIFDAAYELDIHIFRKNLTNALLLSIPGVVIAMFLTGALLIWLHSYVPQYDEWNWSFALMFGALISATDPVAVVALLRELNTSKRFSTLVDAESMLNDGTGIVLFMIFFGAYSATGAPSLSPVVDFFVVVLGGGLLGAFLAFCCLAFFRKVEGDSMIQNSIIIVAAYLAFLLAQGYLNVSGVIALVCFGLCISYYGRLQLKPRVIEFMGEFWELATYLANTLIFIIVGVVIAIKTDFSWSSVLILAGMYIGINLIRGLMVGLLYPLLKRFGYGLTPRESVILSWGGLRGALGLTLALMVSYTTSIPEDIRHQILFQTAGIVTLTLTLNATTIGWMLRKLGLTQVPTARVLLESSVREQLRSDMERYYESLKEKEAMKGTDWQQAKEFLPPVVRQENLPVVQDNDLQANIRLKVLRKEKAMCWELYADGIISVSSLQKLTILLDESFDDDGKASLSNQREIFVGAGKQLRTIQWMIFVWFNRWMGERFNSQVVARYDLCRGFILLQQASLHLLEELDDSQLFGEEEKEKIGALRKEVLLNLSAAESFMEELALDYPVAYRKAVTQKAIRMLLSKERIYIQNFVNQGLLSEKDAQEMIDKLGERC